MDEVTKFEKLSKDDPSLLLDHKPAMNKKLIKIIFLGFGGLCFAAILLTFSSTEKERVASKEKDEFFEYSAPAFLDVEQQDYLERSEKNPEVISEGFEEVLPEGSNETIIYRMDGKGDNPEDKYPSYDNSEKKEVDVIVKERDVPVYASSRTNDNDGESSPLVTSRDSTLITNEYERESLEARMVREARVSSMFFSVPLSTEEDVKDDKASQYDVLLAQTEATYATDSLKQNQQRQKLQFLQERTASFDSYLDSTYVEPIDVDNEVKAGTMIPITLLTGINSDLPGDILAQVVSNVYDSITGSNILIPKGSKVIGKYDSSVAFGQKRVLVAWDRIIRPDGISINLKGMQGADLSGYSGMTDYVDNHLPEIAAGLTMGTAIDVGLNALVSVVSNNDLLKTLPELLKNSDATEKTEQYKDAYVEKLINQQPTIRIRAGMRANIFVNKDIILPDYNSLF